MENDVTRRRKRRWARRNRDHLREYNRRYYERNKGKWRTIYAVNRKRKKLELALKRNVKC